MLPTSRRFLLIIVAIGLFHLVANAQNIATVAGRGVGDGSLGTSASVYRPMGMAIDQENNLYIADYEHHRIRKVNAVSGIITTVAGNGDFHFAGDGGPAVTASIGFPTDVDIAPNGDIYLVDSYNNRIRRVSATTGIISTIAGNGINGYRGEGGFATSASISPYSIALDPSGNFYLSEQYSNKVLKVDRTTGIISTFAGNGDTAFGGDGGNATSASFNASDVATDRAGNVYIAGNYRIRRINVATNIITTVAGSGANTFGGDGGPAISAAIEPTNITFDNSGNYYITGSSRVRKVSVSTNMITTVAGNGSLSFNGDGGPATSASIFRTYGIAVDSYGNIYVSDTGYMRVRKVTSSNGIINTIAGNGTKYFAGDGGPATAAAFDYSKSIAVDRKGNFYIADSENNRVRKVDASTGIMTTVAGNGGNLFSGDGGPATAATLWRPRSVAVDASGNLFITDQGNYRVRKVNASTGIITTVAGNGKYPPSGDGGLAVEAALTPSDVAVDNNGNLFISDISSRSIRKVDHASGIITTVAGNGNNGFSGDGGLAVNASFRLSVSLDPFNIALDSNGNLYVADDGNNCIRKVSASTGIITTVAGSGTSIYSGDGGAATAAGLSTYDVAVAANGDIYIADGASSRVRKVNVSTGIITTIAGNGIQGYAGDGGPATSARLSVPWGVEIDLAGNLYILDSGNFGVRKVALTCTELFTLKNGDWNDPSIWSCAYVPTGADVPTIKHAVSIPNNYTARVRQIKYTAGGKVVVGIASKIQLGVL